jgi:hypothetical protein
MPLINIPLSQVFKDYCHVAIPSDASRVSIKCPFHGGVGFHSLAVYAETNSTYRVGGCYFIDSVNIACKQLVINPASTIPELAHAVDIAPLNCAVIELLEKSGKEPRYSISSPKTLDPGGGCE